MRHNAQVMENRALRREFALNQSVGRNTVGIESPIRGQSAASKRSKDLDLASARGGDEVNDMLLDAIKAKLAILDSIDAQL